MSVTPSYAPMEMRAVAEIPTGAQWQYEPKWDGFRCLAHRDGDAVELTSKSGQALGRYFPEIVRALRDLPLDPCSFDGELLVPIGDAPSFDALSQRIHPAASRVAMLAEKTPATYLVFDLLRDDRRDVVDEPLAVRRAALERIAERYPTDGRLRLSPATTSRAIVDGWFAEVGGAMDGVIAKRLDLPYMTGSREGREDQARPHGGLRRRRLPIRGRNDGPRRQPAARPLRRGRSARFHRVLQRVRDAGTPGARPAPRTVRRQY